MGLNRVRTPSAPVEALNLYTLLRGAHAGELGGQEDLARPVHARISRPAVHLVSAQ